GFKISEISFEGPEEALKESKNTQPAIFLHSAVVYNLLKDKIKISGTAGHSLGEYTALYSSGAISFEDGLKLTSKRGEYFSEISGGTMAAILGLEDSVVDEVCNEIAKEGLINGANYHCPGQVVISGEIALILKAMELLKEKGARRAIQLAVSGAFHSQLMKPAAEKFRGILDEVIFSEPGVKFIPNVTAEFTSDPAEIKENLYKQITGPVRWTKSIQNFISAGFDNYIEMGPAPVLKGMVKKISREVTLKPVTSADSLKKFLEGDQ
ncbi:MAG: ACP S-malonyltransferase, partial [Actinomycetia bacterium]|nr:ACP S-malonyltransferase [Actinomycetes bacterium]